MTKGNEIDGGIAEISSVQTLINNYAKLNIRVFNEILAINLKGTSPKYILSIYVAGKFIEE